ncbi:MAG TPA: TIGR03435 family protein [Bryobacteraceae bacterium]|jgi:uncharacterized protein (TIGR03435 family)|nr:TIGR03435 family protein [Bryobacteraceae bacterium]
MLTFRFLLASSLAVAQGFEVASIKPASSAEIDSIKKSGRSSLFPEQGISISGSRVNVKGLTAVTLIRAAYNLRSDQLVGVPGWSASEPYDIAAKAEVALTFAQARQMLQALLADRFQLKFHRETKEDIAYALVVGKAGTKLTPSAAAEYSTHVNAGKSQVQMSIVKATMPQLCGRLATFVDRPVADQTNLAGSFDVKLSFAPDGLEDSRELPSIFTALQEQLGLKLEATRAPVEILVVDKVARPSAN